MAPIFNLPNEILNEIFGLLAKDQYNRRVIPEVMKLRSVCRTFRAIAYEMPFWQREPFDLVELLPASKSEIVYIYNDSSRFDRLHINGPSSPPSIATLLPYASAKSLIRLSILGHRDRWPMDTFNVFSNITALHIYSGKVDICGLIAHSNLRLTDVRIRLGYEPLKIVLDMLSAPSLRVLRILHLLFYDSDGKESQPFSKVVQAVTTSLHSLEDLWFSMPLDLEWCQLLPNLEKLKTLVWCFPGNDCRWREYAFLCNRPRQSVHGSGLEIHSRICPRY